VVLTATCTFTIRTDTSTPVTWLLDKPLLPSGGTTPKRNGSPTKKCGESGTVLPYQNAENAFSATSVVEDAATGSM